MNRRPLTLLNLIYKLVAKAYQIRLTIVLQHFILEDQSTFIKGSTIHHSLFLTNEVLYEASIHDEDYMYLKLDIVKAFDKIEWPFLLAILERFGFGPTFLRFVSTSQNSATSTLLIHGRKSPKFQIKHSVWQGCPLSPLLFVIALDAPSLMLNEEKESNRIQGVRFREVLIHSLYNFYADNIHLTMKASKENFLHSRSLFDTFGEASRLYYDWSKTKVVYLVSSPIQIFFLISIGLGNPKKLPPNTWGFSWETKFPES